MVTSGRAYAAAAAGTALAVCAACDDALSLRELRLAAADPTATDAGASDGPAMVDECASCPTGQCQAQHCVATDAIGGEPFDSVAVTDREIFYVNTGRLFRAIPGGIPTWWDFGHSVYASSGTLATDGTTLYVATTDDLLRADTRDAMAQFTSLGFKAISPAFLGVAGGILVLQSGLVPSVGLGACLVAACQVLPASFLTFSTRRPIVFDKIAIFVALDDDIGGVKRCVPGAVVYECRGPQYLLSTVVSEIGIREDTFMFLDQDGRLHACDAGAPTCVSPMDLVPGYTVTHFAADADGLYFTGAPDGQMPREGLFHCHDPVNCTPTMLSSGVSPDDAVQRMLTNAHDIFLVVSPNGTSTLRRFPKTP
jgi:hypothetical protein